MPRLKHFGLIQGLIIILFGVIVFGLINFIRLQQQPEPTFAKLVRPTAVVTLQQKSTPQEQPTLQQQPTTQPTTISQLQPTPQPTISVRFANIGDYGWRGPHELAIANLVKSWQPDFIVTSGDNDYPTGSVDAIDNNIGTYYHEYIYPYKGSYGKGATQNRFFPAIGDHDWYSLTCAKESCTGPYFDYFTLPGNERYYEFAQGPVHLFVLNSNEHEPDGFLPTSTQGRWLQQQLAAATEPWKIVVSHHPPYSSGGVHGSINSARWPYKAWGANVVISGNDHTYERLIVDDFPYFVNGLGGNTPYTFTTPALPQSQVRYNGGNGALLAEATPLTMTFRFVNEKGDLIDKYTLTASVPSSVTTPMSATSRATVTHAVTTPISVTNQIPIPNCIDLRVAHGADDVEEKVADGSQYIDSSDLEMANDVDFRGLQTIGLRFQKVRIPAHAKILHAALEFTASEQDNKPTSLVFHGVATANAAVFGPEPYAVSSLTQTTTALVWNQIEPWTSVGGTYQTPDLAAVIQEIVNQPSWQSGNALALIVTGSGHRTAVAFEGKVAAAARLLVEYGEPQPACTAQFTNLAAVSP